MKGCSLSTVLLHTSTEQAVNDSRNINGELISTFRFADEKAVVMKVKRVYKKLNNGTKHEK